MLTDINLRENGIIILRNFPVGCELGIDYHAWSIGDKFAGISNIPPGLHFLFFSVDDKYGGKSPREGTFIFLSAGDVVVYDFDEVNEEMLRVQQPPILGFYIFCRIILC